MENACSLEWAGGQNSLMAWKDNMTCSCVKMLIKEKEMVLRQEV